MRIKTRIGRDAGFTLPELLVTLVVVLVVAILALPALSNARDESHVAHCANNQRLLAASAIAYSFEHDGKFFPTVVHDPHRPLPERDVMPRMRWFDEEVVGKYLGGERLQVENIPPGLRTEENRERWYLPAGLGGGIFVCPADGADPDRSYDFNIWASSLPASDAFAEDFGGGFFDATADRLAQLMIFSDVVGTEETTKGWATSGQFGTTPPAPGARFGSTAKYFDSGFQPVVSRFQSTVAGDLDYVRHGANDNRALPVGAVNIAMADGRVQLYRHDELYVVDGGRGRFTRSTLNVLWTPVDEEIERLVEPR